MEYIMSKIKTMLFLLYVSSMLVLASEAMAEEFIIGKGCVINNNKQHDIIRAKELALQDLANQIQCNIKSSMLNIISETSNSSTNYAESKVRVISNIELEGVRFEVEENSKIISVKAILKRDEAVRIYFEKIIELESQLSISFNRIKNLIAVAEKNRALRELYKATILFDKIEQNIIIYISLGGKNTTELKNKISRKELDNYLLNLTKKEINSVDDAARSLVYMLTENIVSTKKIFVYPMYYKNTLFGSQFSAYFRHKMINAFLIFPQIKIMDKSYQEGNFSKVYGNYWIKQDTIEILSTLYDSTGYSLGSAKVSFPKKLVDGIDIKVKPENCYIAQKEDILFRKQNTAYGNLNFQFWTNFGNENLSIFEGDTVEFFLRVNEPCYINVIYHLANGLRTPIYENYYIGMDQLNQTIKLPYQAVCTPPFGIERIQIFASTEKFPPLNLRQKEIDNVRYMVLAEDLDDFISQMRGLILSNPNHKKAAERNITVSTYKKIKYLTENK